MSNKKNTLAMIGSDRSIQDDLMLAKGLLYDKCDLSLSEIEWSSESEEYGACSFNLNDKKIQHRYSKITPTKTGQFVTIWKRNVNGITEPFDVLDDIDFIIISSRSGNNFGQFIFPKFVLLEKGIITNKGKIGKRGMRVYPPWDVTTNKQSIKTQSWQSKYFFKINDQNSNDLLFSIVI